MQRTGSVSFANKYFPIYRMRSLENFTEIFISRKQRGKISLSVRRKRNENVLSMPFNFLA